VLPIVLDVGTNNQKLIDDPYYLGIKKKRLQGKEYYSFMDEVIEALSSKYKNVFL